MTNSTYHIIYENSNYHLLYDRLIKKDGIMTYVEQNKYLCISFYKQKP